MGVSLNCLNGIGMSQILPFNPRAYEGGMPPHKVFLEFFQDELSSRPAVFSSCAYIPKTRFDTRLVRISCYGYEI